MAPARQSPQVAGRVADAAAARAAGGVGATGDDALGGPGGDDGCRARGGDAGACHRAWITRAGVARRLVPRRRAQLEARVEGWSRRGARWSPYPRTSPGRLLLLDAVPELTVTLHQLSKLATVSRVPGAPPIASASTTRRCWIRRTRRPPKKRHPSCRTTIRPRRPRKSRPMRSRPMRSRPRTRHPRTTPRTTSLTPSRRCSSRCSTTYRCSTPELLVPPPRAAGRVLTPAVVAGCRRHLTTSCTRRPRRAQPDPRRRGAC